MGSVDYETGTAPFERRIGRRARSEDLEVVWVEPQWGEAGRVKRSRQWHGIVDDVSVTGACVRGPADLPVGPGTKAVLRYRGRDTGVVVRHCQHTEDPEVLRFGVEFAVLHQNLKDRVYSVVSGGDESPQRWKFDIAR
ncbi:MAG TPA: PilZ domain-containing protein [Acidimicrobiales bacterium]